MVNVSLKKRTETFENISAFVLLQVQPDASGVVIFTPNVHATEFNVALTPVDKSVPPSAKSLKVTACLEPEGNIF